MAKWAGVLHVMHIMGISPIDRSGKKGSWILSCTAWKKSLGVVMAKGWSGTVSCHAQHSKRLGGLEELSCTARKKSGWVLHGFMHSMSKGWEGNCMLLSSAW